MGKSSFYYDFNIDLSTSLQCRTIDVVLTRLSGTLAVGTLPGADGNGMLQGAWLGENSTDAITISEDYTIDFSENGATIEVRNMDLGFYSINNNCDGEEQIQNITTNSTDTEYSFIPYAGTTINTLCGTDGGSAPKFDEPTGTISGVYNNLKGTCCDDGGFLMISDTLGFSQLSFTRNVVTNRTGGSNITDGVILAGREFDMSTGSFCILDMEDVLMVIDNDGDGLVDCLDPDCILDEAWFTSDSM